MTIHRPLSRVATFAFIVDRLRASGDDPYGITDSLAAFVADGCRGSVEDVLPFEEPDDRRERLASRDELMRSFFAAFCEANQHLAEGERIASAHKRLLQYWERTWPSTLALVDGGHLSGCVQHLCWQIFQTWPQPPISRRRFRDILKSK